MISPKISTSDISLFFNVTNQAILKKSKLKQLKQEKTGNKVYFTHSSSKNLFELNFDKKVFSLQIVKGGVGKTALTLSIAARASLYGAKVLCIDIDQQANLTNHFGIKSDELPVMIDVLKGNIKFEKTIVNVTDGIHLVPSRIDNAILDDHIMVESLRLDQVYKTHIDKVKDFYDLILIDCPPSLGRSVASAALAADYVIAPVTPDAQCLSGLKLLQNGLSSIKEKYGRSVPMKIIFNKFDGRTMLSRNMISRLLENEFYRESLFNTYIRQNQDFANSCANCESIFDSIKPSSAKEDIDFLTKEILDILPAEDNAEKMRTPEFVSIED